MKAESSSFSDKFVIFGDKCVATTASLSHCFHLLPADDVKIFCAARSSATKIMLTVMPPSLGQSWNKTWAVSLPGMPVLFLSSGATIRSSFPCLNFYPEVNMPKATFVFPHVNSAETLNHIPDYWWEKSMKRIALSRLCSPSFLELWSNKSLLLIISGQQWLTNIKRLHSVVKGWYVRTIDVQWITDCNFMILCFREPHQI